MHKNNERENRKRIKYTYEVGQKVLIKTEQSRKYGKDPYTRPYEVVEVRNNDSLGSKKLLGRELCFRLRT